VALAAIGTLGFGAVLGPEAPLIALGSVTGMALSPFVRLDTGEIRAGHGGFFLRDFGAFRQPAGRGHAAHRGGGRHGIGADHGIAAGIGRRAIGYDIFEGLGTPGGLHQTARTLTGITITAGATNDSQRPVTELSVGDLQVFAGTP
jgi:hypothetical protein